MCCVRNMYNNVVVNRTAAELYLLPGKRKKKKKKNSYSFACS